MELCFEIEGKRGFLDKHCQTAKHTKVGGMGAIEINDSDVGGCSANKIMSNNLFLESGEAFKKLAD